MVSLIAAPVHGVAQIAGLPSAAAMHRPQVLMTPNGVPMVNITAPSAAGVSRNLYQQFDVDRKGAILNNSRTGAQTNLGGAVGANPWLANGAARVILNEVRSNDPSLLRGPVEVAGQRAEVVIANPSGIQVDGGAFINASRATLTTGTPEVNALGGLERYVVRDGTITVDGAGLDLSRTDYGAILARAIKVNSAIWANYLQATGGANEIDAATVAGKATSATIAARQNLDIGANSIVNREHGRGVGWRRCNPDQPRRPGRQQRRCQQLHGPRRRIADAQPGQSMPDHLHTGPTGGTRKPLRQGHNHYQGPSRLHGQQQRAMHIHQKRLQRGRGQLPAD
ncbi:hypothetical protein VARIO8X_50204 [Burkholderiales bacterium 8X]|nr:hypothetical protein VARIO8X_50204 [Burkholderiales bacterium 8X]